MENAGVYKQKLRHETSANNGETKVWKIKNCCERKNGKERDLY